MQKDKNQSFTKYEEARILGARALQIAMNAPILIKLSEEDLEKIKFDSLKIAEIEFRSGVLPITVNKPFPKKKEEKLSKPVDIKLSKKKEKELQSEEEAEVSEDLMSLANPEDEIDEEDTEEIDEDY